MNTLLHTLYNKYSRFEVLVNKRMQHIYEDSSKTMFEKLKDVARKINHVKLLQETYEEILQEITESNELNSDVWCFHQKLKMKEIVASDIN